METRKLGHTDITVAPLAFGGNVFGWTADDTTSFQLLDAFVDGGFNLIDTADVYSRWVPGHTGGESEQVLGRWFRQSGKRADVVLATKVGMEMGPERKGLARDYIIRAVEDSLQRLQTDYIDLYQSHQDDPDTPLDETFEAYDRLIREGKVRVIGASNFTASRLAEALAVSEQKGWPAYQSLQPLYNLYDRADFEAELGPLCREKGLAVFTYFSLASGFLTGKYRSVEDLAGHARGEMVKKYLDSRGIRILAALDQIAEQYRVTPARVALAWLIARPGVTAPIASATRLSQLNELMAAATLQLEKPALQLLDKVSA